MKKSLAILSILGIFTLYSCNSGEKTERKSVVEVEKEVVKGEENKGEAQIIIDGITCPLGCAKTIEKKLSVTDGVLSAEVNFEEKAAYVNYHPEQISEKELVEVIENIADGVYKVVRVKVKEERKATRSDMDNHSNANREEDLEQSFTLYVPDIFSAIAKFYSL